MFHKTSLPVVAACAAAFLLSAPMPSHAACESFEAKAYMYDTAAQKKVKDFGTGQVDNCANAFSYSSEFSNDRIRFGTSECGENCEHGVKPGVTYVWVGRISKEGTDSSVPEKGIRCVQQKGDKHKYCWQ